MPIVSIELVESAPANVPAATVQALADALGEVFGGPAGGTWVKVSVTPSQHYAENQAVLPESVRPTFVSVLKYERGDAGSLAEQATTLARIIAVILDRPLANTHIIFEPDGKGRVAFGGNLVS